MTPKQSYYVAVLKLVGWSRRLWACRSLAPFCSGFARLPPPALGGAGTSAVSQFEGLRLLKLHHQLAATLPPSALPTPEPSKPGRQVCPTCPLYVLAAYRPHYSPAQSRYPLTRRRQAPLSDLGIGGALWPASWAVRLSEWFHTSGTNFLSSDSHSSQEPVNSLPCWLFSLPCSYGCSFASHHSCRGTSQAKGLRLLASVGAAHPDAPKKVSSEHGVFFLLRWTTREGSPPHSVEGVVVFFVCLCWDLGQTSEAADPPFRGFTKECRRFWGSTPPPPPPGVPPPLSPPSRPPLWF